MAEYYTDEYEPTDALVQQALAAGYELRSEPEGVLEVAGDRLYRAKATGQRPEGGSLTRTAVAMEGDAQAPDAPDREPAYAVIARAQRRAERAVARVLLGMGERGPAAQPDYQKRLQACLRQVAEAVGVTRDELARDVARLYGRESTAEMDEAEAALAILALQRRAAQANSR